MSHLDLLRIRTYFVASCLTVFCDHNLFAPVTFARFVTRWEVNGVIVNSLLNFAFIFLYTVLHFTPSQIFKLYYGKEPPEPSPEPIILDIDTIVVPE